MKPDQDARRVNDECLSCSEDDDEKCPNSRRPCGHHCNHSWTHDACDWCGKEWGEDVGGEK